MIDNYTAVIIFFPLEIAPPSPRTTVTEPPPTTEIPPENSYHDHGNDLSNELPSDNRRIGQARNSGMPRGTPNSALDPHTPRDSKNNENNNIAYPPQGGPHEDPLGSYGILGPRGSLVIINVSIIVLRLL